MRSDLRLSCVWMLRTWRFKCSPRTKHLPHPGTMQTYDLLPASSSVTGVGILADFLLALEELLETSSRFSSEAGSPFDASIGDILRVLDGTSVTKGTFRPRLFLLRFGIGTGSGMG